MTSEQCKQARELLGWSRQRLGVEAGIFEGTVRGFEAGRVSKERTVNVLRQILEAADIEFTNGDAPGVRLRKPIA